MEVGRGETETSVNAKGDSDREFDAIVQARRDLVRLGLVKQISVDEHGRPLWGLSEKAKSMTQQEILELLEGEPHE